MNATDVLDALRSRWPDGDYLRIVEAPQDSSRGGRKIDLLVIALWQSRGLARDAVEVKVSMSDWRRELKEPAKADWWWQRCRRFWIAAPADIAKKIQPELPVGWGLIAVKDDGTQRTVVKATLNEDPAPLSWATTVGVLRAADGAGVGALRRARQDGYERGHREATEAAERRGGMSPQEVAELHDLRRLAATVKDFEAASGITLTEPYTRGDRLGEAVKILTAGQTIPMIATQLGRVADVIRERADGLAALTDQSGDPS